MKKTPSRHIVAQKEVPKFLSFCFLSKDALLQSVKLTRIIDGDIFSAIEN